MDNYNKELIIAAEAGDLETVKTCIANGADVNFMGPNSAALHCAAFNGHEAIVQLLLDHKADSNLVDNQEFTPLQLAVSKQLESISKLLIANGADLHVTTTLDGTLLHLAAAINYSSIFDIPEISSIDIEARDLDGRTALNVAAAYGSYDMIKALKKRGADINTTDDDEMTPLFNALMGLNAKKIASWESSGQNNGVQVRYVITNGWMRYIKPYHGDEDELGWDMPDWEQEDISELSWSPSGLKKYLEAIEVAELLIGYDDIDKDYRDSEGNNAFILACNSGVPEVLEKLAEENYTLDQPNNQGAYPLHYLARNKRVDSLRCYFKILPDVNPNLQDANGWTPGHYLADQGGHPEMARLLIEKGLDLNIASTQQLGALPEGTKAYDVALHWNDEKIAGYLKGE